VTFFYIQKKILVNKKKKKRKLPTPFERKRLNIPHFAYEEKKLLNLG